MDSRSARSVFRVRRTGRHIGLAIAALILAGLGAVVYWRIPLAEAALHRLATAAGVKNVSFEIARLDTSGAEIVDLRVGTALRIGQTDIDWNWGDPLSRPIARLSARRVQIDVDGIRALIAARTPSGAGATPWAALDSLAEHMPVITFDPTTVTLPIPRGGGEVAVTVDGVVAADRSGAIAAHGQLKLVSRRPHIAVATAADVSLSGAYSLRLADHVLALTLPTPLQLRASSLAIGPATFAPIALTLTGAASPVARVTLDADDPVGSAVAALAVRGAPVTIRMNGGSAPVALPLTLAGTLRLASRTVWFAGRATGAAGVPMVTIAAKQALTGASGKVDFSLAPLRLGAGGLQPGAVLPALARLKTTAGTVSGETMIGWSAAGMKGVARIGFDDASFSDTDSGISLDGLSGTVAFDSLMPLTTPPDQILRVARVDSGVALDDATLHFRLRADRAGRPVVALQQFDAGFAGGRIAVRDGSIGASGDISLPLRFTGVALGTLLGDVGTQGVGGTGTIDGTIPLRIAKGHVEVTHGRLATRGPGRLSIRSRAVRDALSGAGKEVALMLSALDDFRYDRLSVTIEKPAGGIAHLRIETFGRNPAVEQGRPFAINLNLETDIDRIAGSLAEALRLPGRIVGAIVQQNR